MTATDLARLLATRTEALAKHEPAEFARTDTAIVEHLRSQPGPVRVGDVVLHLTMDRLNFVELDAVTGLPIWVKPSDLGKCGWRTWLYRYPVAGAAS